LAGAAVLAESGLGQPGNDSKCCARVPSPGLVLSLLFGDAGPLSLHL
jgi:hypothetical protein